MKVQIRSKGMFDVGITKKIMGGRKKVNQGHLMWGILRLVSLEERVKDTKVQKSRSGVPREAVENPSG
ncbi:hypothetical protein [Rossellomorea aquimaris]|uniref:Uncharacterized protein n=1 Tax=Rossellomorea aquimaris TaxID=189382 RepID=A0A5D4TJY9_9BACI|nr:hypothetical protein [Rossellomorea aquimaris]TYS76007.1 hypothetical protein FZC80_15715 [Rossellomorea aquimaris]